MISELLQLAIDNIQNWTGLFQNTNTTWGAAQNIIDTSWDWYQLSQNPNINWDIVQNNPDINWDIVQNNPDINWDIVQNNAGIPRWDLVTLFQNQHNTFVLVISLSIFCRKLVKIQKCAKSWRRTTKASVQRRKDLARAVSNCIFEPGGPGYKRIQKKFYKVSNPNFLQ